MRPITVLIVDDSALIRKLLCELLADIANIQVVGTATDANHARQEIKRLNPDVLTLDVEMPGMDGIAFLEKIMTLRPMPVIMISTLTAKGAEITLKALEIGAADYLQKPEAINDADKRAHIKTELAEKIRTAARMNLAGRNTSSTVNAPLPAIRYKGSSPATLIAIGSSTGGVEALRDIFMALPENCPPIVMTQHIPEAFVGPMAARLNKLSRVEVTQAKHGQPLHQGHAYLAPGNTHMTVTHTGHNFFIQLEKGEPISGHCPSVDVLFTSVAECAGPKAMGVILTGMGKDGAAGLLRMRQSGAYTIGQNESSCVVYGMPRVAAKLGAVQTELSLEDIASHIVHYLEQPKVVHHAS